MKIIENSKVKEKVVIEKLQNGLTVIIVPKTGAKKKFMIWGTNYGSIDSSFVVPGEKETTTVPIGVAHFLEHKLFEQENGTNSLDVLTSIGVNANAYTTNDYTAYLFECTDNFYEAMDELMDYVQNPYFTDENVEKEKGIIGQEISMYDDYPEWKVYLNALSSMYHNNPVKLDIAGSIETISHIDKEILYKCYNTFYHPSNMVMVIAGDFEPKDMIEEVKIRMKKVKESTKIKRIYEEEVDSVVKKKIEVKMDVSVPLFTIGIKDKVEESKNMIKKHIAIEILLNILLGSSSKLYKNMYDEGILSSEPGIEYEFSKTYAHILVSGQSKNPEEVEKKIKEEIIKIKEKGINKEDFNRIKKMLYGTYIKEYDDVTNIAKMVISDKMKGVDSFESLEEIEGINLEYTQTILNTVFDFNKMVLSIVK